MAILNENERSCASCGKIFSLLYRDKKGYTYKLDTYHCSKSCAVRSQRGVSKEALEKKALEYIQSRQAYCVTDEVCKGTGHSNKTFTRHGVKIKDLNEQLGFRKTKSVFQDKVEEVLREDYREVETEKSFDGLVGNTGYPLRVDFYLPETNTVVEADGGQHTDPNHPWREWNNGTVSEYDQIKDRFFEARGIPVKRIPYKKNLKKKDIRSRLS